MPSLLCLTVVGVSLLLFAPFVAGASPDDWNTRAAELVSAHESAVRPLERASGLAWWEANVSGKDEDFKRKEAAQNKLLEVLSDRGFFAKTKDLYEQRDRINDPVLSRCIQVIYLSRLENQVDPALLRKIVAKSNAVEQAFNVFRAKADGKELTQNDVMQVLKTSRDSARRQAVWEASKAVGPVVEHDLKELVKLRNQAARQLGFSNYHRLQLFLNEQDSDAVIRLFDQLDELTRDSYRAAKAEIDQRLASNCGVAVSDLRPWHYHDPFVQESPAVFSADLDAPYRNADIMKLCRDFYAGIGLPVDDVLRRSDLYDNPGKSPHAFCTDIDREGDVRVLANVVPDEHWMSTMLHELGHSVYSSKNIPQTVPYVLRTESHILTTEGLAMMFGRLSTSPAWVRMMGLSVENPEQFGEAAAKVRRNQLLIFSRWCQVMLRFEKGMYEDPDRDLNGLWWDLVEKYQMVRRPPGRNAPDYASKIHIVSSPCYYHNYEMGELFASQVHHAIAREVYHGADPRTVAYVGNPAVGEFLKARVLAPGRTMSWNALTRHATGKELDAKAFAEDLR